MVLRRNQLLSSNSFNDMTDYVPPSGGFGYAQGHTNQHAQTTNGIECSQENYTHTPPTTSADLAFPPWLMDMSHHTGSLSRTSSLNGSEYISTPPAYTEPSPMYHLVDQALPHSANYMASDCQYVIGNQELHWQPHLCGSGVHSSQQLRPQFAPSVWQTSDYVTPSFPSPMEYYTSPHLGETPASFSQAGSAYSPSQQSSDEATVKPSETNSSEFDSDSEVSSDESSSSYIQRNGSRSNSRSHQRNSAVATVLRLGRWSTIEDPYIHPPQRLYVCRIGANSGERDRRCDKRFARPEHLRRHEITVHSDYRPHCCKVPSCNKAFSRSDNLRDHYWTHIERGGRIGKNDKMSILELREILGRGEKRLFKKLKKRLTDWQIKQRLNDRQIKQTTRMRVRSKL
jgi:hypothetical protein